jgi:ketosteroid isomerase-like protein
VKHPGRGRHVRELYVNQGEEIMAEHEKAYTPEDLTRLFVAFANVGDAEGVATLYEEDAVLAYPPGGRTVGRPAIQALWGKVLAGGIHFESEEPLPTLVVGDIALASTPPKDNAGARAQVVRRQPDGTWLRVIDQPEFVSPAK